MKHTSFYSPKGGQGCTTVAAMFALGLPNCVLVDSAPVSDMPAVLGVTPPLDWDLRDGVAHQVTGEMRLVRGPINLWGWDASHAVYDCGPHFPSHGRAIMVVRPCFVALKRAQTYPRPPDGIVLIEEPGRALSEQDISAALGAPIVSVLPIDPAISRAVDSGLLASRRPPTTRRLEGVLT